MSFSLFSRKPNKRSLININRIPTVWLLALLLAGTVLLSIIVLTRSVSSHIEKDVYHLHFEDHRKHALFTIHQIQRYIERRIALFQFEASQEAIKEFLEAPKKINHKLFTSLFLSADQRYLQEIYDNEGDLLFSTAEIFWEAELALQELENLSLEKEYFDWQGLNFLHPKESYLLVIAPSTEYLMLTIPIFINDSIKGFIKTYIATSELNDTLYLKGLKDIKVKMRNQNFIGVEWGNGTAGDWHRVPSQIRGLNFSYSVDQSEIVDAIENSRVVMIGNALSISLISILLAIFFANWIFVRPLKWLAESTTMLKQGEIPPLSSNLGNTKEMQDLYLHFIQMSDAVIEKEKALLESNQALRQNTESLVHAEKMASVGEMSAGIAHEINNPVGYITNNLSMLREYHTFLKAVVEELLELKNRIPDQAKLELQTELTRIEALLKQDDLDFILSDLDSITKQSIEGAKRIKSIVNALKGYAHSGELKVETSINSCIESALNMVRNELKYHCEINTRFGDIPVVDVIPSQITQVLVNLLLNAAHATEGLKGEISINSFSDEDNVFITIEDNGCGIAKEHLSQIFNPFFTTKEVGKGTGLGMSICYDIVRKHGGEISVESELEKGTIFMVRLPFNQSVEQ